MKNMIIGIFGCFLVIYTVALTLSIYSIYVRQNELNNCLASCLESAMRRYYEEGMIMVGGSKKELSLAESGYNSNMLKMQLEDEIEQRLQSDSKVNTTIYVCDFEKGIISAKVEEEFELPVGIEKTISCTKTIIADRSAYE